MIRKAAFLVGMGILLLTACGKDDSNIPQPQPPTAEVVQNNAQTTPIPTRIITLTPRPTEEPTLEPTAAVDLVRYEGTWTLLLRYEIDRTRFVDQFLYSSSVGIIIGLDGTVFGSGEFKPVLGQEGCTAEIVKADGLGFAVTGTLEPSEDTMLLHLHLEPTHPDFVEEYKLTCADQLNNTEKTTDIQKAIMWSVLIPAEQLDFTFDLNEAILGVTQHAEGNVATLTRNDLEGTMAGEIYLGR